jgi:hypothetical protein
MTEDRDTLYIDGAWIASTGAGTIEVISPTLVTIAPPAGLSAGRQAGLLAVASRGRGHDTLCQPLAVHVGLFPHGVLAATPALDGGTGGHQGPPGADAGRLAGVV